MMSKLIDNIKRLAALIKGEMKSGANTAERVGGLFEDIASELEMKYDRTESDEILGSHNTAGDSHRNIQDGIEVRIAGVDAELRQEVAGVEANLKQEIGEADARLTQGIAEVNEALGGHNAAADAHRNIQDQIEGRIAGVETELRQEVAGVDANLRQEIGKADTRLTQGIAEVSQGLSGHTGNGAIHKTSEQIRSEIVDGNIPATIARLSKVDEKDTTVLKSAEALIGKKADLVHTHAATQIDTDGSHRFLTDAQVSKLTGIEAGANNYIHPGSHSADMIVDSGTKVLMTVAERSKLSGIAAGANNYVHPGNHSADMITDSAAKVMMTAAERSKLSGIAAGANNYVHPGSHSADIITDSAAKVMMTATERSKLGGIEAGANNYVHPGNHSADIITDSAAKVMMTAAERSKLAGIENNDTGWKNIICSRFDDYFSGDYLTYYRISGNFLNIHWYAGVKKEISSMIIFNLFNIKESIPNFNLDYLPINSSERVIHYNFNIYNNQTAAISISSDGNVRFIISGIPRGASLVNHISIFIG